MTIIGTVRRPNGATLSTTTAMGTTELKLVHHVPGSGQYKFEFVPPFHSVPAVTVSHVWSMNSDDWAGSVGDRAAIEFITPHFLGIVTANDRATLVDRYFALTIIGD
jgi:hypothetical protein